MAKSTQDVLAEIAAIRERVAERYPTVSPSRGEGQPGFEPAPLADLMPLFEARDAAEGKVASVGKVNPRRGGAFNAVIQMGKRSVARGLGWFIREQVDFNAAAVRAMTETIEALNEVNRSLATISARQAKLQSEMLGTAAMRAEADSNLRQATDALSGQIRAVASRFDDVSTTFGASLTANLERLRADLVQRAETSESEIERLRQEADRRNHDREKEDIRLLRTLADIQNAAQQQWGLLERELRKAIEQRGALAEERSSVKAAEAAEQAIGRMETLIHRELRLLRQRVGGILERGDAGAEPGTATATAVLAVAGESGIADSLAFSDKFRGTEEDVKRKLQVYVPRMRNCSPVADLGCGRGEFLDLLREDGGEGIGVEANPELAAIVARKGHRSYSGDLFSFLAEQEPESLGGIFCAHVIEHMPAESLARLIAESYRTLRPGGMLALETPNPACLAIFATYFYLDSTHVRPVPSELTRYLLEESGFTKIEVLGLRPAEEEFPELKPLPEGFRQKFFGYLDYGILAQKT